MVDAVITHHRVTVTGDEPHYLIVARALTHFSPHVFGAYQQDYRTHYFYAWPPGSSLVPLAQQHMFAGSHGVVSIHGLGVPLLLMPSLAVAGKHEAVGGFLAITAAGIAFLFARGSSLAHLGRRGQLLFALVLVGPTVLIAATQLYPDLPAGLLLACSVLELARAERDRALGPLGGVVVAVSVAFLPWLHIKNLAPAIVVLVAATLIARRVRVDRRLLLGAAATVAASWALLLAYNLYYFGHPLGVPQASPSVDKSALAVTIGLLFDRDQGLFVQVPLVVIGIVGLLLARRAAPIAIGASLLSTAAVLALNGSYLTRPYGGDSLAGRFEWTAVPLLLAWSPFAIRRVAEVRSRAWLLGAVAAALWVVEWLPVPLGHHHPYNAGPLIPIFGTTYYPGWWWGLNPTLPAIWRTGPVVGRPGLGVALELAIVLLGTAAVLLLARGPTSDQEPATGDAARSAATAS